MERLLTLIAALVAGCVVLLLPTARFVIGYESQRSILRTEAEINARLVTQLINANPELWKVETLRLEELLKRRPEDRTPETRAVFDAQGRLVSATRDPMSGPLFWEQKPVHDAGQPVGTLRVTRSLRPLLWATLWAAALSSALGAGIFVGLRVLPLRALRRAHERLAYLANYDSLTGLPNRALFRDRLDQAMQRVRAGASPMALMFLDLDRFKDINDSLGHAVGDQLLRHVSATLASCLRAQGAAVPQRAPDERFTVSHLGGDEFTVLVEDAGSAEHAAGLARALLAALRAPFWHAGQPLRVSASIGISLYAGGQADPDTVLRHTDLAMYRAKALGRDTFQFYSDELNAAVAARLSLEAALHGALERGEFALHYQPKARLDTGAVTGVEALLRWNRPGHGLVAPDVFIPVLEDIGLIVPVGLWVIETACAQLACWDRLGFGPLDLAVNVSARQFREPGLADAVAAALARAGLDARRVELELTESLLMQDDEVSRRVLASLARMRLRVAIDDFGTGHSSLAYLKRFSVDTLKIDRSFVREAPDNAEDGAIATAVVALARSLRLQVVAEGVETDAQVAFLRSIGCDKIQGYWLSRPLAPEAFAAWLPRQRAAQEQDTAVT